MVGFDAKKVSTRLKEARKKKGLNQEQLAKAADISLSGLQNYEATNSSRSENNKRMGAETLSRLAQLLDVSSDYLLGLTDDSAKHPIAVDDLGLTSEACAVLRYQNQIKEEGSINYLALKAISKVITSSSLAYVAVQYYQYLEALEGYKNRDELYTGDITESLYNVGVISEGRFPPTNDPKKDFDSILLGRVEAARHNIAIALESALTSQEGE